MREGPLGPNTHCDPQCEPLIQVTTLSGWTKSPHMGLAMHTGPSHNQRSGVPVDSTQCSALVSLSCGDT